MDMITESSDPGAAIPTGKDLPQRIQDFLAQEAEGTLVSAHLFGSLAEGSSHRVSDVDVGVVLRQSCLPDLLARSQEQVRLL